MKVRDVIKQIERDGWELKRQRGSHRIDRHPHKPGTVTEDGARGKDIPFGPIEKVLWQAGFQGQQR